MSGGQIFLNCLTGLKGRIECMPTYEYRCSHCGFEFEEFQSIAAEPISICPKCGAKVQRKISGGGGLIFKGSGFYITDYKKGGTRPDSPVTKPEAKSGETKKPKKSKD
jgi:putative FmdB family regulatory protein